jgi:thioredoxin 1
MMIDFSASWCGPCKRIYPLIKSLSDQYLDMVVCKVDIDEVPELAKQFSVQSMPTFIFIKNGEIVEEFSGADRDRLVKAFASQ